MQQTARVVCRVKVSLFSLSVTYLTSPLPYYIYISLLEYYIIVDCYFPLLFTDSVLNSLVNSFNDLDIPNAPPNINMPHGGGQMQSHPMPTPGAMPPPSQLAPQQPQPPQSQMTNSNMPQQHTAAGMLPSQAYWL